MVNDDTTMLGGITALELDAGLAAFAGKLLADAGADVIAVEPPTGAPGRSVGPFLPADRTTGSSLHFGHYNTSKRSVVLDRESAEGRAAILALVAGADVVLDGLGVGVLDALGLGYEACRQVNPGIVYCSVTPFGTDGPWSTLAATDLTQLALGGIMAGCGYDDGVPTADPIAPTGGQAAHVVGIQAAMATLAALIECGSTGAGQRIDVSAHEALAVSTEMAVPFWLYQHQEVRRQTGRHAMPGRTPAWQHLCADGRYFLALPLYIDDKRFAALVEWFDSEGMAEDLADEAYRTTATREPQMAHVVDVIGRFCAAHDSAYLFREAQARRLPWAPVNAPDELLDDPQFMQVRHSFVDVATRDGQTHPYARLPYLIGTDQHPRPAPMLGEHTDEVLRGLDPRAGTDRHRPAPLTRPGTHQPGTDQGAHA